MNFGELMEAASDLCDEATGTAIKTFPQLMGLDNRCAHMLYVGPDFIAARKSDDRKLQYYGGFEYVEPEYRLDLGEFVFYSSESDRVQGHLDHCGMGEKDD